MVCARAARACPCASQCTDPIPLVDASLLADHQGCCSSSDDKLDQPLIADPEKQNQVEIQYCGG